MAHFSSRPLLCSTRFYCGSVCVSTMTFENPPNKQLDLKNILSMRRASPFRRNIYFVMLPGLILTEIKADTPGSYTFFTDPRRGGGSLHFSVSHFFAGSQSVPGGGG